MTRTGTRLWEGPSFAVDLFGYGQVGRALAHRLSNGGVALATIHNRRGLVASHPVEARRRVLVDATAPHYRGPASLEWTRRLVATLRSGTPVVTCNKAPLATAWDRLEDAARWGGATLWCSATVGGGTPILPFLRRLQESHGLQRVEANLSGTLSFLLPRIAAGETLASAVAAAQREGFAEPDPGLDLDGTDAYAKALILHNALFGGGRPLTLRERERPLHLDEDEIRRIARGGFAPSVTARIESGRVSLDLDSVHASEAPATSPGHAWVRAVCHDGSVFRLDGPGAGPAATAGALAADLLSLGASSELVQGGIRP